MVQFIKSHGAALTLYKKKSPPVSLVQPVETRFALVFMMLTCLLGRRDSLQAMLHDDAWASIPWERRLLPQARWVHPQIQDGEFWRYVEFLILVMEPIHQQLRRMDKGGMMMSSVYEWSRHLVQLQTKLDVVPADLLTPCVREVRMRLMHLLEPAHAAAHLLKPGCRSLRYYASLHTTTEDAEVVHESDRFLLAQTGVDPTSRDYLVVCDQMRRFHARSGDWGDRLVSDAEAEGCHGDQETHPSPAERNWAAHERIQTAKRSNFAFAKLEQLVEITTNLKLASCRQQGGGYVLSWVMEGVDTERRLPDEDEDEDGDPEPNVWGARPVGTFTDREITRQIDVFRKEDTSRPREVSVVFGDQVATLLPFNHVPPPPSRGAAEGSTAAVEDGEDDWMDVEDVVGGIDRTAEQPPSWPFDVVGGGADTCGLDAGGGGQVDVPCEGGPVGGVETVGADTGDESSDDGEECAAAEAIVDDVMIGICAAGTDGGTHGGEEGMVDEGSVPLPEEELVDEGSVRLPQEKLDEGDLALPEEELVDDGSVPLEGSVPFVDGRHRMMRREQRSMQGTVPRGWSSCRRVTDSLRRDYDRGRGLFARGPSGEGDPAAGASEAGRSSVHTAGRILGLDTVETRRTERLEVYPARSAIDDRWQGLPYTSGEEDLHMPQGSRRHDSIRDLDAEIAADQQRLADLIRKRERRLETEAQAEEADTETEPIDTAMRRERHRRVASAAGSHLAPVGREGAPHGGGRGGRRGALAG
ncbi:hypothetical protein CBR_g34866 [Chara braunii]|uniref:Uncharacterized protein n=1 Tax=Chara braunii TaxID=69332 RepID=A0A388LJI2_CHABU|nr:hypothetical protein CBR_g34866 [Chara braunii]|eukprot:GBG82490.1 hypothetical protein CBR_g34866 [Chara braunii]